MDAPLISVIVPVYKVEKYLDRCVQSIVDQTYRNLEIILVDDGSPDRCGAMCDAWAEKDSRIKVIHKENGGLSDARNAGMVVATGEYTGFIDSDDYIAPEMYQLLFDRMLEDGSDIAACGVEMVFEDGTPLRMLTRGGSCVLNRKEAMAAIVDENWLKQPVWNKLYKTELIRDVLFPVGKCHEDIFWSYRAVARAEKVSVFDSPCYFYVQRSGSIMGTDYSLKRLDVIEAKLQRLAFLEREFPEIAGKAGKDLAFSSMHHGQMAMRHLKGEQKTQVLKKTKEAFAKAALNPGQLSLTHRCWVRLAKCSFELCCAMRNILRIGL